MPPDLEEATITLPDEVPADTTVSIEVPGDGTAPAAPALSEVPQDGIEDIKRQLAEARTAMAEEKARRESAEASRETERLAREEAERRAREANGQATQYRGASEQHEFESVVNALAAASNQQSQIEGQLATATEEGRFADAAKLQGQLARVATRVEQLEQGKASIEARRANPAPAQQVQGDPRSAYLSQVPPKTAAWLRQHDRFFTDKSFENMVRGAHSIAVGQGLPFESDEYFRKVEELSGLRAPATQQIDTPVEPAPQTVVQQPQAAPKAPVPAAPVSRTVPSSTPGRGTQVTLTPQEREMARHMFPKTKPTDPDPDLVYAKHKAAMAAEGWEPAGIRR